MDQLNVVASPLPFSNKQTRHAVGPGASIRDIVNEVCPERYTGIVGAVVEINGHFIPQENWARVRPKLGTLVNVRIVPMGGGGKKNPLVSLLSIAVMIAAPYAAGAVLSGMGIAAGATIGIGSITYGQLLTGAIGIVGKMLVSSLAPPPKPSNFGNSGVSNTAESPTQFIEGAQNSLNPFGVVPICLGTNRMFPLQAARPYTETQDNDQYVRQLFTYGYAENMVIAERKIGDTPIENFNSFEIEDRFDGDLHEGTELFSNDVFQEDLNVLLSQPDGFTQRSVQPNSDEVIVDVTFPRGLARFNDQGKRISRRVELELQYSPLGEADWSPGASEYKEFNGGVFSFPEARTSLIGFKPYPPNILNYRTDIIAINKYSGKIEAFRGPSSVVFFQSPETLIPTVPADFIKIAQVYVETNRVGTDDITTITVTDIRSSSLFGVILEDSSSFIPTKTGDNQLTISSGSVKFNDLNINGSQTEALRRSVRIQFPERGDYEIRIRRITNDSNDDQIFDQAYLTSIKSVTYQNPINLEGLCGTAIRIKATDQLNGALDRYNAIVSNVIPDYFVDTDTWEPNVTSNPASIYRYVLQGAANARPIPDEKIDLEALQEWHTHCEIESYTYNRVIDYETSVDEILRDVAAAGSASPAIVDGKRTIVIDRIKEDITQIFTPRNSWDYQGEMLYSELPHAFRVQFRNSDKGYIQDERIVYDDGYNEGNATKFEGLELQSCTNPELAFKTARRHIATARLQPETHSFMVDVENLVSLRGDRVKLVHDVPLIGLGQGRIKSFDVDSSGEITGITVDDLITIPINGTYYTRIRLSDGTQLYKEIEVSPGSFYSFNFVTPFVDEDLSVGDLAYFVQAGQELDLLITRIEAQADLAARITCVDYAPARFTAESAPIPTFNSNITVPLQLIRPSPPELIEAQTDEEVMLVNPDGTFLSRAVFTLNNTNDGEVFLKVRIRRTGDTAFTNANVLESSPERLVLTGLDDGSRYDIELRYGRSGSSLYSLPLQLNNFLFVGSSGIPHDVTGFIINVTGENALLKWDANRTIDLSHYTIKYSRVFTGATWGTAQILEDFVYENRLTIPFQPGTYLIKAVDLSGNVSENATAIITYDPGILGNVVEILTENPDFPGLKDNVSWAGDSITLADVNVPLGYYYFSETLDLGADFTSFVSASIVADGIANNNIFAMDDMFAETNLFGTGNNEVYDMENVFDVEDVYGVSTDAWDVRLEYRVTQDDPDDTGVVWSGWLEFNAGNYDFRAIEFRLRMRSLNLGISPRVSVLSVTVDMPDRIERGEDLTVPVEGATITYVPPFISNPAVAITVQDGDANDEIEFITKTSSGFTFKVYNTTSETYVERLYDFIASGYGRENT